MGPRERSCSTQALETAGERPFLIVTAQEVATVASFLSEQLRLPVMFSGGMFLGRDLRGVTVQLDIFGWLVREEEQPHYVQAEAPVKTSD